MRQRKDGTLAEVSIAAAPISDGSGGVLGNMVAYTDITERKAQDAEVHRLNSELARVPSASIRECAGATTDIRERTDAGSVGSLTANRVSRGMLWVEVCLVERCSARA